jgi:hypothetical protein
VVVVVTTGSLAQPANRSGVKAAKQKVFLIIIFLFIDSFPNADPAPP